MRWITEKLIPVFVVGSFLFGVCWLAWTAWLFSTSEMSSVWSKGELGDFVNGLGGIAFFIICLTSYLQHEELKRHRIQASESDILRAFEVLKPELENLSVRIVAKISLSKEGEGYTEEFQKWHNRFNNENDRTVFLRRLSKDAWVKSLQNDVVKSEHREHLTNSIHRFLTIMKSINNQLDETRPDENFRSAIKQTEIFQAYETLKKITALCQSASKSQLVL